VRNVIFLLKFISGLIFQVKKIPGSGLKDSRFKIQDSKFKPAGKPFIFLPDPNPGNRNLIFNFEQKKIRHRIKSRTDLLTTNKKLIY